MVKLPRSIHAWTIALVVGVGSAVAGVPAGAMEVPLSTISGRILPRASSGTTEWFFSPTVSLHEQRGGTWSEVQWFGASPQGDYSFAVEPGTYRIGFEDPGMLEAAEYYDNAGTLAQARDIAVGPGEDVTGIDAQFDDPATIWGRITGPDGKPVRYGLVTAYRRVDDDPSGAFKLVADATTDAKGRYTLHQLQGGHYRLQASDSDGYLLSAWYGGGTHVYDGAVTTLGVGEDLTGVDVEMALAARIAGRVTNTGGRTTYVRALIPMEGRPSGWGSVGGREVAEDGTYVIGALPAGTYRIEFDHTGDRQDEYWDNERSVEEARPLTVTVGVTTRGINARLDQLALHRVRAPKVTGRAKVGKTLKVSKGTWEPRAVTAKYRWFVKRGKKFVALKKATKPTLRLTRAMRGKRVRVRVTVSARGYRSEVFTSRASKTITR